MSNKKEDYNPRSNFVLLPSSDKRKNAEIKNALWAMENNKNSDYTTENLPIQQQTVKSKL